MKRKFLTVFREIRSLLLLTTGMANNKKDIKERLKLIAKRPKMLKITAICLAILMIAVCVVACTNALAENKEDSTDKTDEPAAVHTNSPEVTPETTPETRELPALNPDSKNGTYVFEAQRPEMPRIDVWEYKKIAGQPVDIKAMLSRIWEGQEYETFEEDGKVWMYRLPLYQSKHGKFREEVQVLDNGFSYRWEINENYPKRKNFTGNAADKKAHTEAFAFAELMLGEENLLGDGGFLEHGLPWGELRDEDNNAVNHMFEFNFEHRLNDIPVFGEGVTITVIPEGIPSLSLRWSKFEPVETTQPQWVCDFDRALYTLEYLRSFADQGDNVFADNNIIISAKAVYCSQFSDDENTYRPAWQFDIVREEKLSYPDIILIDMQTGDVYNEHEGLIPAIHTTQSKNTSLQALPDTKNIAFTIEGEKENKTCTKAVIGDVLAIYYDPEYLASIQGSTQEAVGFTAF